MDELSNNILRTRERESGNYFKRHFECNQVQWMKLSEMWKVKNRLKLLILFLFCSLDEICKTLLYWYTIYKSYTLQHLPGSGKCPFAAVCAASEAMILLCRCRRDCYPWIFNKGRPHRYPWRPVARIVIIVMYRPLGIQGQRKRCIQQHYGKNSFYHIMCFLRFVET